MFRLMKTQWNGNYSNIECRLTKGAETERAKTSSANANIDYGKTEHRKIETPQDRTPHHERRNHQATTLDYQRRKTNTRSHICCAKSAWARR